MRIKLLCICFIYFQLGFSLSQLHSRIPNSILNTNKIVHHTNTSFSGVIKTKHTKHLHVTIFTPPYTLKLLPNPAKNEVQLNFSTNTASFNIKIIDALGRTIKLIHHIKTGHVINTSHFTDGIYFVSAYSSNKALLTKKLIINH